VPETETAANIVTGVGDLPGSTSESAVALLPEERQVHVKQTSSSTSPSAVISDSERADMTPQATMDSQTSTNSKVNTASRAPESLFSTTAVAGHTPLDTPLSDTTSGPHAGYSKTDQESITTATTHSAHTAAPTSADITHTKSVTDTTSEPGSVGSSSRKSGFMTKLKGEAKVLSGKIGRNEEKIEEGKRMLGKV
jgi:flagellum-specific peptidoglycan hydrolase FlgJ